MPTPTLPYEAETRERAYPSGWFRLLPVRELPPGAVRTVRAMSRDLVIFRTASGRYGAVDPICPHLGAHLGRGGSVVGESLRCPFHGLRFAVDGACVGSERSGPVPRVCVGSWELEAWQGQVMIHLDPQRRPATWRLPTLADDDTEYGPLREVTLRLRGHVEDVAENGVDFGHFGTVHSYRNVRETQVTADGAALHTRFTFDRAHPLWPRLGTITGVFDTDIHGLGCSITRLTLVNYGIRARLFLYAIQVEPAELDFTIAVQLAVPRALSQLSVPSPKILHAPLGIAARLLLPRIIDDALQDREIWAHRVALARPRLLAGDGPVSTYRRWVQQFYAPST